MWHSPLRCLAVRLLAVELVSRRCRFVKHEAACIVQALTVSVSRLDPAVANPAPRVQTRDYLALIHQHLATFSEARDRSGFFPVLAGVQRSKATCHTLVGAKLGRTPSASASL